MGKLLSTVLMLSLSYGVAEAKTTLLEDCVFNEAKNSLMFLKATTGDIKENEFNRIAKRTRNLCLTRDRLGEKENLNEEESDRAVYKGFRRAVIYTAEGRDA